MHDWKTRVIVFDENLTFMRVSYKAFADILHGEIKSTHFSKDYAVIETSKVFIRFYVRPRGSRESCRGMRCDYLINNTQDQDFNDLIAVTTMSASKFLRGDQTV